MGFTGEAGGMVVMDSTGAVTSKGGIRATGEPGSSTISGGTGIMGDGGSKGIMGKMGKVRSVDAKSCIRDANSTDYRRGWKVGSVIPGQNG